MPEENVKVAVRVRPFNSREKQRNAKLIVEMSGATTKIADPANPKDEAKKFTFDYSYWSHDGFTEKPDGFLIADTGHPNGKKFADQTQVYNDIGEGVMKNAWEGYNATLFAYGQTGSGKSFSVVGYGPNKGIVPQFCDQLFVQIDAKKASGTEAQYEVTFSMLEIYNEQVRDLLNPKGSKVGLKVRQHPKKGFYADGLQSVPVGSYKSIDQKMDEGTQNRTVAATNMNATSSRAHTIVGITFTQKQKNSAGEETAKVSVINLVDLAGSERAESTGATGDRLKEGAAINQSLSSLGNVISALADQSNGKKVKVPFRDSVLTKLLKNALGGNSKTIMIAAISPADINFDESLGTLRYADRAKQIKTKASVNEDPTAKLIRDLQEENEKLKAALGGGPTVQLDASETEGMTTAEKAALQKELEADFQAQMEENQREMENMKKAFEEKLSAAKAADSVQDQAYEETAQKKQSIPHIYNLNFDSQLSGKIIHFIEGGQKSIGKGASNDVIMMGPSVQDTHAVILEEGKNFFIEKPTAQARLLRNGEPVSEKTELHHNDRVMFGTTQLYVFCNPKERDASKEAFPNVTFEMAQEEIAANSGFDMKTENKSQDDMLLQEDLMEMLPAVEEANSISQELDKKKKFEILLVSREARGELTGRTKVYVKMIDLETEHEFMWPREKFLNRKFVMQEMYEKFADGEEWQVPEERDPFMDDANEPVHVGTVIVYVESLAYHIDTIGQLEITDYKGQPIGLLNIELIPCNKKGKDFTEDDDMWVDDPFELVGRSVHFNVKVLNGRGLPNKYTDYFVKYWVYVDDMTGETKKMKDTTNPDWNDKKQFDFPMATKEFVQYLKTGAVMMQLWGRQKPVKNKKTVNTKNVLQKQALAKGLATSANTNDKLVDAQKVRYAMELAVAKKKAERAEAKVAHFRELVRIAEELQKPRISLALIKSLLAAPTKDAAEQCYKMIEKEKGVGA